MNRNDLLNLISNCKDINSFVRCVCGRHPEFYDDSDTVLKIQSLGYSLRCEDGYGGEGQGDEYWGVFSLEKDGEKKYFRLSGFYASYYGAEIETSSLEEVEPHFVQVREWKNVRHTKTNT